MGRLKQGFYWAEFGVRFIYMYVRWRITGKAADL